MSQRRQHLQIRVNESQKAAIRAAAARAGLGMSEWLLARALPRPSERLTTLVRRADLDEQAAWAELIELLQKLSRVDYEVTVRELDVEVLSLRTANYVAALVEMTAVRLGCDPPPWTRAVAPLPVPWFGTRIRRLREYLLTRAPVAFRRRNIFIDAAVGDRV